MASSKMFYKKVDTWSFSWRTFPKERNYVDKAWRVELLSYVMHFEKHCHYECISKYWRSWNICIRFVFILCFLVLSLTLYPTWQTYSSLSSAITSERLFSHKKWIKVPNVLSWSPNIHPWLFALFAEGSSCYINMWSKVWSTVCKGGSCNQSLTHNYIWITLRFLFTNLFFLGNVFNANCKSASSLMNNHRTYRGTCNRSRWHPTPLCKSGDCKRLVPQEVERILSNKTQQQMIGV